MKRPSRGVCAIVLLSGCARAGGDAGPPMPDRSLDRCTVVWIVDGDTINCEGVGSVRLIGIDAPEREQGPYYGLARRALESLVPNGSAVLLELGVEERDRFGRILAYVWSEEKLVNWRMVRGGWAVVLTYPPNTRYVAWLTDGAEHARTRGLGLWAVGGFSCRPIDHRRGLCG